MTNLPPIFRICFSVLVFSFYCFSTSAQNVKQLSCEKFYKKTNFMGKVLDKKVVLDVTDINEYSFRIVYEDGAGIKKSVDLYTNFNGKRLRTYLQPGDMIRKTKNDIFISVARIINKHMDIKRFDTSCD